jgi:dihydrofolate reductase
MKTLKMQMQITTDGFVATPESHLDWMALLNNDPTILDFINHLTDTSDTILMGRKMSPEFLQYWESVKKESPEYDFAQKMINIPKIIFSKTVKSTNGRNARVENGDLVAEVKKLKNGGGKDIVAYGGTNFMSSLIKENLIDDYYLFVNPIAIGKGLSIFHDRFKLKLVDSKAYKNSGVIVNHYKPA